MSDPISVWLFFSQTSKIYQMELYLKYRSWIQGKTRIGLAWLFSIALIACAREYPNPWGVAVIFLGASLRFWASGFLMKDTQVAVGGPYSLTRNPLYLGTFLMALGAAMAAEQIGFVLIFCVSFLAIYHYVILEEEEKLKRMFGKSYVTYTQSVPRFFPRLWPLSKANALSINPDASSLKFSWSIAWKNKAYEAYAAALATVGLIWLIAYIWKTFI